MSIIGRNGVGKSTLLELIVGRAQRHSGEIRIGDVDFSSGADLSADRTADWATCRRSARCFQA